MIENLLLQASIQQPWCTLVESLFHLTDCLFDRWFIAVSFRFHSWLFVLGSFFHLFLRPVLIGHESTRVCVPINLFQMVFETFPDRFEKFSDCFRIIFESFSEIFQTIFEKITSTNRKEVKSSQTPYAHRRVGTSQCQNLLKN